MYLQMIILGLVCLAAPFFVRYGGYESRRKPFDLVAIGGIFFLLGASFGLGFNMISLTRGEVSLPNIGRLLMIISFALGWVGLVIGAVWSTLEVLREPDQVVRRVETRT